MNIKVYVSTDEQSLFGNEQAPEGYDTTSLLEAIEKNVQSRYPDAGVQVYSAHNSRVVSYPDDNMVYDVCQQIVHSTWQEWLVQFE